MRVVLPIALAVVMTACHHGSSSEVRPHRKVGDYGFRISLSGADPLDGVFTIAADSVLLETAGQACRRDFNRTSVADLHFFTCFPPSGFDKFDVTIDSGHPFSSSWGMTRSVPRTRTICVRYTVNARGQQVCAETRNETYFVDVRSVGRLRITGADTVGATPVAGEFTIEADTVTLEADTHSCRRVPTGIREDHLRLHAHRDRDRGSAYRRTSLRHPNGGRQALSALGQSRLAG
jgi:hypothetical protein